MALGVWVAPFREQPAAPEEQPMGRAALLLEREGCPVIVGSHARDGVLIGRHTVVECLSDRRWSVEVRGGE
jgi:hypothetical protein